MELEELTQELEDSLDNNEALQKELDNMTTKLEDENGELKFQLANSVDEIYILKGEKEILEEENDALSLKVDMLKKLI